jgi:TolB-like protein
MRTAALCLTLLCASPAAAAQRTVAVLYFDNNTALREYDVLQKGMADMLITDLMQSDQLRIVERNRLDAVIGEVKLQRSKFFDPATAVKLGKLVGASYAITGAFTGFEPEVRIDVRMIDVKTGDVVVAAQGKGGKEKFFDLEQELVTRFLAKLATKVPSTGGSLSLGNALKYSQGLDTADQGDLKGASTQLATVVRDAPEFQLAKTRYTDLLKKLREAGKRRDVALSAEETELLKGMDEAIKKWNGQVLSGAALEAYFCYRAMRTAYLMWKLEQPLPAAQGPLKIKVADQARLLAAKQLLNDIWDNEVALIADAELNHQKLEYKNHACSCPMALLQQDRTQKITDFDRLRTLGVPWYYMPRVHPADRAPSLVVFAATGTFERAQFQDDEAKIPTLRVMPTMVALDPAVTAKSLALLDAADQHLEKPASLSLSAAKLKLEVARATLLLTVGRREEAIAALQSWLDKNPKSSSYKSVEQQVEALLGVGDRAKQDAEALSKCAASDEQISREIDRLFDAEGVKAVTATVATLDSKCAAKANAVAAWHAALRGDCGSAKAFVAKAADEDVSGVKSACE